MDGFLFKVVLVADYGKSINHSLQLPVSPRRTIRPMIIVNPYVWQ
jgi:hypothetical protein